MRGQEDVKGKYFVMLFSPFRDEVSPMTEVGKGPYATALFDDEASAHWAAGDRDHEVFRFGGEK